MIWFKAFVAGFIATLVFHQGVYSLFFALGAVDAPPFNLSPVPPFGVPSVLSLAFFGGLWGLPLWALIRHRGGLGYWGTGIVFGAVAPTVVAMLVVFPLKDLETSAATWIGGLILNGAWGLGVAVVMRFLSGPAEAAGP